MEGTAKIYYIAYVAVAKKYKKRVSRISVKFFMDSVPKNFVDTYLLMFLYTYPYLL